MGYRSSVRAVFYDTSATPIDGESVKSWLKANFPDAFNYWEDYWSIENHHDGDMVMFELDYVKWYENSYAEVTAFEEMLKSDKFKTNTNDRTPGDANIAWEFGRIGDDSGDVDLRR